MEKYAEVIKNLNLFIKTTDLTNFENLLFTDDYTYQRFEELILTKLSHQYQKYYLGQEITPIKVLNDINYLITHSENSLIMMVQSTIYMKMAKSHVKENVKKIELFKQIINKVKKNKKQ